MASLSRLFSYISHFRKAGHQVGRKVGDMLEVLTYAYLSTDQDTGPRLHLEPKLFGFSGAGHKVEFALSKEPVVDLCGAPVHPRNIQISELEKFSGFIECKKVGGEQTVNLGFKNTFVATTNGRYRIPFGAKFSVKYAPRGADSHEFFLELVADGRILRVTNPDQTLEKCPIESGSRFIFALTEGMIPVFLGNESSLREVDANLSACRILEIFDVDQEGAIGILNNCLAGPQTPEKAKQASFVALDARKRRLGTFDRREQETDFVSILERFRH